MVNKFPAQQKANSRSIGQQIEALAAQYLQNQGLTLLKKNYHCKLGEIDLIMQNSGYLIFVEVRFRQSTAFGSAVESVTRQKQQKLRRAAKHFLMVQPHFQQLACRFDVLAAHKNPANDRLSFDWFKNAFD